MNTIDSYQFGDKVYKKGRSCKTSPLLDALPLSG